jgi:uncharacterized protein YbaP (TraB family)
MIRLNLSTRLILLTPLLLITGTKCCAQDIPQRTDTVIEKALIWRIEGMGLKKPSYIMGELHTEPKEMLKHVAGWDEAFSNTEQYAFEAVGDSLKKWDKAFWRTPEAINYKKSFRPSYNYYQEVLGQKKYMEVETWIKMWGGDPYNTRPLDYIRKNINYANVLVTLKMKHEGVQVIENDTFITAYLYAKALNANKKIYQLDDSNIRTQCQKAEYEITKKDIKEQIEIMYDVIRHLGTYASYIKDVDSICYYNHDINRLSELQQRLYHNCRYFGYTDSVIVHKRNEAWIKKIPKIINKAPTLIVVGLGHLPKSNSDAGLIYRLRKMGYKVTPLNYTGNGSK